MGKKKFKRGSVIETLGELDRQTHIMVRGKVYHHGFWQSWQYRYVTGLLKQRIIYKAEMED